MLLSFMYIHTCVYNDFSCGVTFALGQLQGSNFQWELGQKALSGLFFQFYGDVIPYLLCVKQGISLLNGGVLAVLAVVYWMLFIKSFRLEKILQVIESNY